MTSDETGRKCQREKERGKQEGEEEEEKRRMRCGDEKNDQVVVGKKTFMPQLNLPAALEV